MGRNGTFALVTFIVACLTVLAVIIDHASFWVATFLIIAILVAIMSFIPRTRQPEVTGENKYHLHP
jgi:hypothetical protein